jgi:hypothetical protein
VRVVESMTKKLPVLVYTESPPERRPHRPTIRRKETIGPALSCGLWTPAQAEAMNRGAAKSLRKHHPTYPEYLRYLKRMSYVKELQRRGYDMTELGY